MTQLRTKTLSLLIVLLLTAAGATPETTQAQYTRPGSVSATFLNLGVSARAAGMGGAYIAMVDGATGTYYNPSALPWQGEGTHIAFNHLEYFDNINHEFMAVSRTFDDLGTFGASVTGLYTDQMKVRTPVQQGGTGATFVATSVQGTISYARRLTDHVTFGGSVRGISLNLYQGFTEQAVAADIAASYEADFRDFRFGMMISNIGSEVKFVDEAYPLPVEFTFGARMMAARFGQQKVLATTSAFKPNDGAPKGQVGAEYSFRDLFFLRGGYKINYDAKDFSFGGGVKVDAAGVGMRVNYGYAAWGKSLLGQTHRFSLNLTI